LGGLESSGAEVAHTDWQELVEQGDGSFQPGAVKRPPLDLMAIDIEVATATSRFWAPPAALLYRRTVVESIGKWREDLTIIQDARFLFDAAAYGARFLYIAGIGAFYRVRSTSLSRRSAANFVKECSRNTLEIEDLWFSRGTPLNKIRTEAIHGMWGHLGIAMAINGLDGFSAARSGLNRTGPRRYSIEGAWLLRICFGKRYAAAILRLALRFKSWMRQMRLLIARVLPGNVNVR
jgi:hypothetical protein